MNNSRSRRGVGPAGHERAAIERDRAARPGPTTRTSQIVRRRRTQAERTDTTRRKLIDAAIRVMRERGYGGLTTLEVAEVAGVSRGALLHHFPSRHDLVVATTKYMNELVLAESRRRAEDAASGSVEPIDGVIRDAKDFFFSDFFFVSLAIAMGDAREEDLRRQTAPLSRESRLAVEAAWLEAFVARGVERQLASRILALTLSIVRGFSIRVFIDDNRKRVEEVLETWKDMVELYVSARPDVLASANKTPASVSRPRKPRST